MNLFLNLTSLQNPATSVCSFAHSPLIVLNSVKIQNQMEIGMNRSTKGIAIIAFYFHIIGKYTG